MGKKLICLLLALIMVSMMFAGCSAKTEEPEVPEKSTVEEKPAAEETKEDDQKQESTEPVEPTVITVWTNARADAEYVNAMIEKFNAENPYGIIIEMTVVADDYTNSIKMAYDGGTAPDIANFGADGTHAIKFAEAGMIIPLNDYIAADEEFQKVNEPYEHMYQGYNAIGDDIYLVYCNARTGVRVEYNKDLLEAAGYSEIPNDLESYVDMAIDVYNKTGVYGIGFTSSAPVLRMMEPIAERSGITIYDYKNGRYDFSGWKPILEQFKRLVDAGVAYPDQQGVDNMRALFAAGQFALWGNASQEAAVFTDQFPIKDFEWGVAVAPSLDGGTYGAVNSVPQNGHVIMSTCKNPDLAWEVIKFFQSEEFVKGYCERGYAVPVTSYINSIVDTSNMGKLAEFVAEGVDSVYPALPAINLSGDNFRATLWNAVMGYVGIDEAIEDLNTRYNEALDQGVADGTIQRLVIRDFDPMSPSSGTIEYLSE